jgi:hypothetical protein
MNNLKKNISRFLLAVLIMFSLAQIVKTQTWPDPESLNEQDKIVADNALMFLTDIAKLNTSSYNMETRILHEPGPNHDAILTLKFTSSESNVTADFLIKDNSLFWYMLYPIRGSPNFVQPASSNALNTVKETVDRLNAFSAKEYLLTIRNMLNTVTELESSKITMGDFTQEIAVSGNTVKISWEPFAEDLSNPTNKLYLEFQNGNLVHYADYLGFNKSISSEIKISEAQAIQIATERVRAFSYVQDGETVSDFTILDSLVIANMSLEDRGNNTLYPFWSIKLPLDKEYPGGVTAFQVGIWADTGEVSYFTPIGYYGDPNAGPIPLEYSVGVVSALIAAATIAGYLLYKRKR